MGEALGFDVVIVGAGPAGLSAAIRLKQLSKQAGVDLSVCVLEKGSEVGAHILSGNVFESRALSELIPDWQERGAPITVPVSQDRFYLMTKSLAIRFPTPPQMHNSGNYVISLANLTRWLGQQAEALEVDIYPGFSVAHCLFNDQGEVCGVETVPMGLDRQNQPTESYQPGVQILAKYVMLGEGCRGSVTRQLFEKYQLTANRQLQTYGIGLKEIWEVEPSKHQPGTVIHTIGWPLDQKTYGGSFIYHMENHQVACGFVVGLDYQNPYLSPYDEFQRFKHHPKVQPLFEGGRRVAYGARALNEGGYQSIPQLSFPGGCLIGCSAGFLNVPQIKGAHTAMKSGMIAAEVAFEALKEQRQPVIGQLDQQIKESWVGQELYKVRNIRPGFRWGLWGGLINAALETYIFRGKMGWTLSHHVDHQTLKPADQVSPIMYPKPDGKISFDKLTNLFYANLSYNENQPCNLVLNDPKLAIEYNWKIYRSPETLYCPANVYEVIFEGSAKEPIFKINASNCVHCKTCDIKDPLQNITWVAPEGGSGPNYPNM